MLKRIGLGLLSFILLVGLSAGGLFIWSNGKVKTLLEARHELPPIEISGDVRAADVEFGKRVATVRNGCTDCHAKDFGGQKVVDDPMIGQLHGPNLTPAALAQWSDDDIARALRYGIRPDGSPLVFMPSHEYQNLSRDDLAALIAYLRSLPPVERERGPVTLGPLAKVLIALGKMPTMIPASGLIRKEAGFVEKPAEEASAEFGRYLVTASCIGCHGASLAGGPIPGAPPEWLPAADISRKALSNWTEAQFIRAMRDGVSPTGGKIRFPMPIEMTKQMSDTELKAIWAYLSTS